MRKSAMTPDALPHRGTAAPFRIGIGLALAASACVMLWGVSTHGVSASEFGPDAARETPMTLEDRVAALAAELAQVKAENAKLARARATPPGNFPISGRASPMPRSALRRCAPPPTRTRRTGAIRLPRSRRITPS